MWHILYTRDYSKSIFYIQLYTADSVIMLYFPDVETEVLQGYLFKSPVLPGFPRKQRLQWMPMHHSFISTVSEMQAWARQGRTADTEWHIIKMHHCMVSGTLIVLFCRIKSKHLSMSYIVLHDFTPAICPTPSCTIPDSLNSRHVVLSVP